MHSRPGTVREYELKLAVYLEQLGKRYKLNLKLTGTSTEHELKFAVYLEQLGNMNELHVQLTGNS
jgi:hypothetical protein